MFPTSERDIPKICFSTFYFWKHQRNSVTKLFKLNFTDDIFSPKWKKIAKGKYHQLQLLHIAALYLFFGENILSSLLYLCITCYSPICVWFYIQPLLTIFATFFLIYEIIAFGIAKKSNCRTFYSIKYFPLLVYTEKKLYWNRILKIF